MKEVINEKECYFKSEEERKKLERIITEQKKEIATLKLKQPNTPTHRQSPTLKQSNNNLNINSSSLIDFNKDLTNVLSELKDKQ